MKVRWLNVDQATLYGGYGAVVIIMWCLKYYYSLASVEDLAWILTPLACMVAAVDAMPYVYDAAVGWIRSDGYIVIAPACSGVNFLIMVFGLNCAAFLSRLKSFQARFYWILVCLPIAYGLCLCANSVRIWASIIFYENQWHWGWFTPARLHQIIGVVIYFSALGLNYVVMDRIIEKVDFSGPKSGWKKIYLPWQPLLWYACGTIAVPTIHNIFSGKSGFVDPQYALITIMVSTTIWLIVSMGRHLFKRKPYATRCFNCGR